MNDLQAILNEFEKIKFHKPMASKKLQILGKLISEAYIIDPKAALNMWRFLLQYNDTDDEKIEEYYTVRVFRKITLELENYQLVDLLIQIPEIVDAYKQYHGTSCYCCGALMEAFLKENYEDLAYDIFLNFLTSSQENIYVNCIELFTKSYFSGRDIINEKDRVELLNYLDILSSKNNDKIIVSIIFCVRFCLMTEMETRSVDSEAIIREICENLSNIDNAAAITKVLDFAIQKLGLKRVRNFWERLTICLPKQQILPDEYKYRNKWECCLEIVESVILSQYYTSNLYIDSPMAIDTLIAMLAKRKYDVALQILNNSIVTDQENSLLLNFLNWLEGYPFYASRISVNYNHPFELSESQIDKIVGMLKRINYIENQDLIDKINDTLSDLGCEGNFELLPYTENKPPQDNNVTLDDAIPFVKNSIKKYGDEFGDNSSSYQEVIKYVGRSSVDNEKYFENWCYLVCNDFDIAEFIFKNRVGEISAYTIIQYLILQKKLSKADSLIKEHMEPLKNKVSDFTRQNRWDYRLLFDLVYKNSNDEKETFDLYNFANSMHVSIYGFEDKYISSKLHGHKFYKPTEDLKTIYATIQNSFNYILTQNFLAKDLNIYKGLGYGGWLSNIKDYDLIPAFLLELSQNPGKMSNAEFNRFYKKDTCQMTTQYLENLDVTSLNREKAYSVLLACVSFSPGNVADCLYKVTSNNLNFNLNGFLEEVLIRNGKNCLSNLLANVFNLHICEKGFVFDGKAMIRQLDNWIKFKNYACYCWDHGNYLECEGDWLTNILEEIYDESEQSKNDVLDKLKLVISKDKYEKALYALEGED